MDTYLIYILVGVSFLIVGILLGSLFAKLKLEKETIALKERIIYAKQQLESTKQTSIKQFRDYQDLVQNEKNITEDVILELKSERENIRYEKENIQMELTQKMVELEFSQTKLFENKSEIEHLQEKFTKEFENLANRILEEKSVKFTEQNQKNIQQILHPLQEKIQTFENKVDISNQENTERYATLGQHIKSLHEQNIKISAEANNLTKALKGDSKIQGNWGELILERVLEKSGLEKGREYELEKSFSVNMENKQRLRPDVIIHMPDNKKMIIDSKVSLTAYEKFVNTENEIEKQGHLKMHIASINRHVIQLSDKKYEDLYDIESPNFVLLFVPIEPAFAIASNHDKQLYNKAFEKNIIIVTPSTLLATLRTIDSMWNTSKQQRNAMEIARQAGALYDKFTGLIEDLTKIGKKIDESKNGYFDAMNKLVNGRGNLVRSVEKIKQLGAKTKKSIPESIINKTIEEQYNN